MLIYTITFVAVFAVLIFLKFCEGSPIRSGKSVVLVGLPLAFLIGWYFNHAFPAKAKPLPQTVKADAYRLELERTYRRIDGVDRASVHDGIVELNFAKDKPIADLKKIAWETGGSAGYFLKTNDKPAKITVHITVQDRDRFQITFDPVKGVTDQQEY